MLIPLSKIRDPGAIAFYDHRRWVENDYTDMRAESFALENVNPPRIAVLRAFKARDRRIPRGPRARGTCIPRSPGSIPRDQCGAAGRPV